jgi:hypothetical protein
MTQFTNQFAVANWVIVPTGQAPPRPEDQKWFLLVSGVALFTWQGLSTDDWRRDSLRIEIDLTGPIQASGRSAPPGRELKFEVEQWAPYSTMNSIFNQGQSINAGYAVDAFRPIFATRDTFTQIFDTLEVDLAVRDSDGFIFRIGYHLTLVGTIVDVGTLVRVPDLINLVANDPFAASEAAAAILNAGLRAGMVQTRPQPRPDPFDTNLYVVGQSPGAGTEVPLGTRVNVVRQRPRELPPRPLTTT